MDRLCRRIQFYTFSRGAAASDLAAIRWFFDRPYETPAAALARGDRGWVFNYASNVLRAQGRLQEAMFAMREASRLAIEAQDWVNSAIGSCVLCDTALYIGDVHAAAAWGEEAVTHADSSADSIQMIIARATFGGALHAAGMTEKAEKLLADAERRQGDLQPEYPLLQSGGGYHYCDLLLSLGRAHETRDRALRTLDWVRGWGWVAEIAQATLTLGRAYLALSYISLANIAFLEATRNESLVARSSLDEAVQGLRGAGRFELAPQALLARAAFRRAVGDWDGGARDLDEVREIAEPGPMRLYLCDCALERARLALARREAFAPLNGLVEPSPPPPVLPDATEATRLLDEARKELDAARKLVAECGYHRRDGELAELDAVVAGRRRFADLPPRV